MEKTECQLRFANIFPFWDKLTDGQRENFCRNTHLVRYAKGENNCRGINIAGQRTRASLICPADKLISHIVELTLHGPETIYFHVAHTPCGTSSVKRPSFPLRNSSSRILAMRSVSTSPPDIRNPRLRPASSSSSQP